mgnify:CR=1 FL=1
MRWLKRDFVIKFSVIVAIAVTIIVSMNLVELLDKYVKVSLTSEKYSDYEYMELKDLKYLNNKDTHDNTERIEMEKKAGEDLDYLLDNLPEFEGNVVFPLVYCSMNDGMIGVSCDVIIAYNEELPYIIDTKNCSEKGIYIGNSYNGYWSDGKVQIGSEEYEVAGIVSSNHLQLNNGIYIPYDIITEKGKTDMYRSLIDYMTFEGAITVYFASDRPGVVEHDIELMKEWCRENGIVEVVNVAGSNESYVEDEKNDIRSISYQIIKKFVCYLAAAFCLFAVFEAIRLYMNRKKADIMILWSAGSKKTVILKMLIKELGMAGAFGVAVLIGVVLAFAAEWLIYGVILGCNLKTVFIYGAYSFAAVVVLTIIMITVMLAAMLHKPVISIIKKEQ